MQLRKYGLSLIAVSWLMMMKPASASLIEQVSESQAQGLTGNGARVTVWNGSGTNIDFTHTGEVIQRVWLDDPSFVTIDFDGNLCGHNRGGCGEGSGASLIHLRRVNGIRFPNLPQTNSTLLTVITDSAVGRKTYLFEVGYGAGAQQYASLVVTPDDQSAVGGGGITVTGGRTADWNDVEHGLHQVIAQKLLAPDSPVVSRVQNFLASVRNGMTLEQALSSSGISMAVVSHLAQVGYQSVTPTTALTPSPTTLAPVAAPPVPAQSTP